ncbi:YceI family protein [Craterilacuibacter sp.]|uniref:YceI family protein n=1 Tax=Craterilacuibacter sp. TaxID=2870909 RepID=UPI003F2B3CEF
MHKTLLACLILSATSAAYAAPVKYDIDTTHASASYEINHLGLSLQSGTFSQIKGSLLVDEVARTGKVDVTIPTATLNSYLAKRDEHLKSADFFNVAKYPTMHFVSDKVEFKDGKPTEIAGKLTLLGVTQPVTLKVRYAAKLANPMSGVETWGVNATGQLKRSEFGMKTYLPGIADDVKLDIALEAAKAK